ITFDSQYPDNSFGMGYCAYAAHDSLTASRYLAVALAADPSDFNGHALQAKIRDRQGRIKDARKESESCIRLEPWCGTAYTRYGSALQRWGEPQDAIRQLTIGERNAITDAASVKRMLRQLLAAGGGSERILRAGAASGPAAHSREQVQEGSV
ncbi:MAG TPA: hypothetical protein VGS41_01160, partial [Chthonomonadales bacterium]|nr:hypothetical protein [Chthonomonadales bacterium]